MLLAVFLIFGALPQAMAQKVLMLTTNIDGLNPEDEHVAAAFGRLEKEFSSHLPDPNGLTRLSVLGDAGGISSDTFGDGSSPYDLVFVVSAVERIEISNWNILQNAMANRQAHSFVFFVYSCCFGDDSVANASEMLNAINVGTQSDLMLGASLIEDHRFPLNTQSPFASALAALPAIPTAYFSYINNVPARNTLFVSPDDLLPSQDERLDNVFGFVVPIAESNAGQGACVHVISNYTFAYEPFWSDFQNKLGPAFLRASAVDSSACGLPQVTQRFNASLLVLQDIDNSTTLEITLSNTSPDPITNANLSNTLPLPLVVGTAATTTSCIAGLLTTAEGANTISHTGFTIPPGGCSITVPVQWPLSDAGRQACTSTPTVTNTITPGSDFVSPIGQANIPATASLSCQLPEVTISPSKPSPIPMLDNLNLALTMAALALLGMLGIRARRR